MKILLTANTAWNIAHFRGALISRFLDAGHEVVAASPYDKEVETLEAAGVRHILVEIESKGMSPFRDLFLMYSFRQLFLGEEPDIVFSFTVKNNIYGALAARASGTPFVPNVSGLGTAFLGTSWLELLVTRLYKAAFRSLPLIFFQNPDDRDLFVSRRIVQSMHTELLPGSGIDTKRFCPYHDVLVSNRPVTFLLIARLLRDKGVYEFVEAARILRQNGADVHFQLLGATGSENRTAIDRETVNGWVREGVVEYLGAVSDVRNFIASADCVVLPSYREGTPRTLLEGGAMGKPLVATDVPGCREIVRHGENGYLCLVRDAVGLAEAMEKIIEDGPARRAAMGQNGRLLVERNFDQSIVVQKYMDVIDTMTTKGLSARTKG